MHTLLSNTDNRGILTLNMNRPQVHNAFDADMIRELIEALSAADQDDTIRMVVITGTGACFSAGADINWMRSLKDASLDENQRDAMQLATLLRRLNYLSKPSIARINGAAYGGGLGLIATCDITIAADHARFGLTEVRLGLAPAVISPYVIRRIGESNARRYFLSGERFDAGQAKDIGLIQQYVAASQLDEAVENIIRRLLKGGPLAIAHCKQLAFTVMGHKQESQKTTDELTTKLIADLRVSAEGQEGLAAFLEKRNPEWIDDKIK
jgi:methylglutaconyl-CoA hydratase